MKLVSELSAWPISSRINVMYIYSSSSPFLNTVWFWNSEALIFIYLYFLLWDYFLNYWSNVRFAFLPFISELWHDILRVIMQQKYVLFLYVWFLMHVWHAITGCRVISLCFGKHLLLNEQGLHWYTKCCLLFGTKHISKTKLYLEIRSHKNN